MLGTCGVVANSNLGRYTLAAGAQIECSSRRTRCWFGLGAVYAACSTKPRKNVQVDMKMTSFGADPIIIGGKNIGYRIWVGQNEVVTA